LQKLRYRYKKYNLLQKIAASTHIRNVHASDNKTVPQQKQRRRLYYPFHQEYTVQIINRFIPNTAVVKYFIPNCVELGATRKNPRKTYIQLVLYVAYFELKNV